MLLRRTIWQRSERWLPDAKTPQKGLALRGAIWGLGHTLTLFAVCAAVLLLGFTLTDRVAALLEFSVGIMLVLLGANVLWHMRRKRVHFHVHSHGNGKTHIHAHSHAHTTVEHARDPHDHRHPERLPLRALWVGLLHGAAGSAGLLALVVAATQEPMLALGYVALFGLGSIVGMALLSAAIAWPLGKVEKQAKVFSQWTVLWCCCPGTLSWCECHERNCERGIRGRPLIYELGPKQNLFNS